MQNMYDLPWMLFNAMLHNPEESSEKTLKMFNASLEQAKAYQFYFNGVAKYINDFTIPCWNALNSFMDIEQDKSTGSSSEQTFQNYLQLAQFSLEIAQKGLAGSLKAMNDYQRQEIDKAFSAWINTIFNREGDDILDVSTKKSKLMEAMVYTYPNAISEVEPEFGFHFDEKGYVKFAETDRFVLYHVLPTDENVVVREQGKPTVIIPPYVLGANILAFLPGKKKSYVHAFANQGIPTYIRILKDVNTTPAVQVMTGEDDAKDTRLFCEQVKARHEKPVTLNGYCQGGFTSVINLLSGELDGLIDALITCVSPMDGTLSKALVDYINSIPGHFKELGYASKILPNGNQVVDGTVMSWIYKLKSIETDAPLVTFYRDLMMLGKQADKHDEITINKTAAALNYWLAHDQSDLPKAVTQLSFDSYTIPITDDGTLPVKLFGRELNFKRLKEQGIKWLICYAEKDNLIEKEAVIAPSKYIDVELTEFPKGHAAVATSWSHPESACALHTCFGEKNYRGPVRYHLDLEETA